MALAAVLAATLLLPAVAAARSVAPPGNSEADQYFETLPDSTGPRSPDSARTPVDAVREGSLRARTARELARRGAGGEALARAVGATGPAGVVGGGGGPSPRVAETGEAAGGSGEAAGPAGLDFGFPLLLALLALAALAFALSRRRGATG